MRCWRCVISPVMTAGRKAGRPSVGCGASRRRLYARNGRFVPRSLVRVPHLLRRRSCPHLSLPHPVSQRPHRSLPPSSRPHHLNFVPCILLRPIRGDALSSAVVPLSREIWVLQKSHAHPVRRVPLTRVWVGGEAGPRGCASANFGPEVWPSTSYQEYEHPPRFFSRVKLQSAR